MVRPLQRKKNKNPHLKVSRKGRKDGMDRAKRISFANVGLPLIAQNWDRNLTLRQNYQRMGLTANLNGKAGGEAIHVREVRTAGGDDGGDFVVEMRSREEFDSMPSVGKAGGGGGDLSGSNESDAHMSLIEEPVVVDPKTQGVGRRLGLRMGTVPASNASDAILSVKRKINPLPFNLADALIDEASKGEAPRHTHSSSQEVEILTLLSKKYKDDYDAMARDRKLNPYQLSAGQLKRKFKIMNKASA
ncbi:ribosome biogenesis protein Nop16 [Chytriomyces cf. hyalinus JEL632]|nr:ribosome biogenesis protein Nop16 [Chytriomyces cf. hyalinus JEL632]